MEPARVYPAVLVLGASLGVICFAVSRLQREPGHRAAWRTAGVYLWAGLVFPALIYAFSRRASPWWLLLIPAMLALNLRHLIRGFAPSIILLQQQPTLPGGSRDGLIVAHLSDLHLCTQRTMEGGLPADEVMRAARAALQWSLDQKPDLVLISGDITDSGAEEEWQLLRGLLDGLPSSEALKVLMIPGNHDLTITLETFTETDGGLVLAHEQRARSFARHVLGQASAAWAAFHDDRWSSLREMLERCQDYALAYDRMPPRRGTHGEQWSEIGEQWRGIGGLFSRARGRRRPPAGGHSTRPRDLREYVPPVIVPEALATEAARPRGTPWPTVDKPLYQDLLELVYPIILYENAQYLVIGLNSNTIPALSIVDGAIGMLGQGQLDRLEHLLGSRAGKCAIVALHHHLGCPPGILTQMKAWKLQLKVVQLADIARLRAILRKHAGVAVFHGHKHVGYWARLDDIQVVAASSVAYGNRVGQDNCHVYAVRSGGEVSLMASTRISAQPAT